MEQARRFVEAIHARFPDELLADNCSSSFDWTRNLSDEDSGTFVEQIGAVCYSFLLVTLAGFHKLNHSIFELARDFVDRGWRRIQSFNKPSLLARSTGSQLSSTSER